MNMKKLLSWSTVILISFCLSSCTYQVQHTDQFYNDSDSFPYLRFPLIKPYYVDSAAVTGGNEPWTMYLKKLWAPPNYLYLYSVTDLRKLSVKGDVIMAYSPYVDEQADQSVRENYYHWFVVVVDKNTEAGFHTESAFLEYIQQLGIQQPDWQSPDNLHDKYYSTGCLPWIPDCK